ncbi:MAG: ABC transporter ATP-binding protein [Actinomycetia bacterium]|nr:ABC transporter ATP-binding protein [Actinomycetes bacterium]
MSVHGVSTRGLVKRFGEVLALDHVDLDVPSGSVYGLVGPNGAGKTTLLGILSGLVKPSDGDIDVGPQSIGVLPDTPKFDRWLTGYEVVDLARTLTAEGARPVSVDDVLEVVGLGDTAHRRVRGYSRGMLQRLGLAAAVVSRPDLLLLDEPAAALDPAGRREVLDLVKELSGSSTVVFSSHILDDVAEVCDVIGILRRGQIVYQGSLDGLLERYRSNRYVVRVRHEGDRVAQAIVSEPWVSATASGPDGVVLVTVTDLEDAERHLIGALAKIDVPVVSVNPAATSLEEIFLEVTR